MHFADRPSDEETPGFRNGSHGFHLAPGPQLSRGFRECIVSFRVSSTRRAASQEQSPEKRGTDQEPRRTPGHDRTCGGCGCRPGQADHFQQPARMRAAGQKGRSWSSVDAALLPRPAGAPAGPLARSHGLAWPDTPRLPAEGDPPLASGARAECGDRGEGQSLPASADTRPQFIPPRVFRKG